MTCVKCNSQALFLLEGGLCKKCYVAPIVGEIAKEKRFFTIDVNAKRKQARRQKAGGKRVAIVTVNKRKEYFREYNKRRRLQAG